MRHVDLIQDIDIEYPDTAVEPGGNDEDKLDSCHRLENRVCQKPADDE